MTTFAQVKNGTVISVIVAEQDYIDTLPVEENVEWVKTDPQTMCNKHYDLDNKLDSGTPFRGNYATVGGLYDKEKDVFCGPKPGKDWKLNEKYYTWEPPVPVPNFHDGQTDLDHFVWDDSKGWVYKETDPVGLGELY